MKDDLQKRLDFNENDSKDAITNDQTRDGVYSYS